MSTRTAKSAKGAKGGKDGKDGGGKLLSAAPSQRAKDGKTNKRRRKPTAPVKVSKDRNWLPIAMFTAVGVLAAGLIVYAFLAQRDDQSEGWQDEAAAIEGVVNYREQNPEMLTRGHVNNTPLQYEVLPPVGGDHNGAWQYCQGAVYRHQIPNEHAVHSLEHGAVWITYSSDLAASEVDALATIVEGTDMLFLSEFPGLDAPISLQAWGYQLKVDTAGDPRVGEFIRALRINAAIEADAGCSGGVQAEGAVPVTGEGM